MLLCTLALPADRAAAAVLCESFLATNPSSHAHVLLFDDDPWAINDERMHVHRLADVIEDRAWLHRLGASFIAERMLIAVRPHFLSRLNTRHPNDHVIELPPGCLVLDSLDSLAQTCGEHSFLTRATSPVPTIADGLTPHPVDLANRPFDTSTIVVGPGSAKFLAWWTGMVDECARFGVQEAWFQERDWLGVDWLTGAVATFDAAIDRDPENAVSRWSAPVEHTGIRWVDLRGFDPHQPWLLDASSGAAPRVLLSERPELALICEQHAAALLRHGWEPAANNFEWSFGRLVSGLRMTDMMRASYIKGNVYAVNFGEVAPPDPFNGSGGTFVAWLRACRRTNDERGLSRYLSALWDFRPDLQQTMPDVESNRTSTLALIEWAKTASPDEADLPDELRPTAASNLPSHPADTGPGINVSGFLSSAKGLGEAGRAVLAAVAAAGIDHSAYDFERTPARKEHELNSIESVANHDTNIICVNAEMMSQFKEVIGPTYFEDRYNIGVWFWEAGTLNADAAAGIELVDEIWVTAPYVADVFRAATDKPINVMPLPVTAPPPANTTRAELGLPDGFMYLFVFDYFSTIERKNPIGLVRAFAAAFAPNEGPILVIKSINGDKNRAKREELRYAIGDRTDIHVIDEFLPAEQKSALINLCDCYVSMHRGEGFGLGMAEAMMLGKPVIGTGYSGNLAFMTAENSFLIDYELTAVVDNDGLYPTGGEWAEPSVEHGASLMRLVHDDPVEARRRAELGRKSVEHALHPDRLTEFVRRRYDELHTAARQHPQPDVIRERERSTRRSRARALAKRSYWKVLGPIVRRINGDAALRELALHQQLEAVQSGMGQLHEQLGALQHEARQAEERILLHAHTASEYARVAARRTRSEHDD